MKLSLSKLANPYLVRFRTVIAGLVLVFPGGAAAQDLTVLHNFTNSPDGAYPYAALIQARDGNFYSTTEYGGVESNGVIFRSTSGGDITAVAQCNIDGVLPAVSTGALLESDDGTFYGVSRLGGPTNLSGYPLGPGTVFRTTTNGVITTFGQFGGVIGSHPVAAIIRGPDGNFYGTTKAGGGHSCGAIYKLTATGSLVEFYDFVDSVNTGSNLFAGLVLGSNGDLYGATIHGGADNDGTLFKITTNAALTVLLSFNGANGAQPYGTLLLANDGNYYGTTYAGGESNLGTVFKMTPDNVVTTLLSFDGINGANPYAGLIQGTDGNLYGTTYSGGVSNLGTIFQVTTNGVLSTLLSFEGTNGANPYAPLMQASDGCLYGTTVSGGVSNIGTVFRLSLAPQLKINVLDNNLILSWPSYVTGYLLQTNGNLGTTNWASFGNGSDNNSVTSSLPAGNLFFRLQQQE
jgi:uncharacterized repeat protein (TIGR03803 family)